MRVVLTALLLLASLAAPAAAAEPCTDLATPTFAMSPGDGWLLDSVSVEVPGCDDDELVGLQLVTEGGDVPADGPLHTTVQDGRATFDVGGLAVAVGPIVGVRVFLLDGDADGETFEVSIDRRFFNAPGNEQVGLRRITVQELEADDEYVVPGAPERYRVVECVSVGVTVDDGVVEGSGTYTVDGDRDHLVCYRMTPDHSGGNGGGFEPGGGTGPSGSTTDDDDDTAVLGDEPKGDDGDPVATDDTDDGTGGEDAGSGDDNSSGEEGTVVLDDVDDNAGDDAENAGVGSGGNPSGPLAMTGTDVGLLSFVGTLLLLLGLRLLRARRARKIG